MFGRPTKDTIKQLTTLAELGALLNSTLDPKEVRKKAIEAVTRLVECETSSLLLLDEGKGELYFEVALGKKGDRIKEIRLKVGEGIAGWVAETQEPLVVHDVAKDSRHDTRADSRSSFVTRNMIAVPVKARGKLIGVLEAINKLNGMTFYKQDLELLLLLANQVGIAIDNARLYEAIQETFLESAEANKMLGLTFQSKGMVDLALERFKKVPLSEDMLEVLYNLGFDCERKRRGDLALLSYKRIAEKDPHYKDIEERMERLSSVQGAAKKRTERPALPDFIGKKAESGEQRIGPYQILEKIGKGMLGTVYKGKDPKILRPVAIKVLEYSGDLTAERQKALRDLFLKEAEIAGRLVHPNIVVIYDAGEDWDYCYWAMEFLDGKPLSEFCQKDRLLPIETVVQVGIGITEALSHAHANEVLHLSLRPSNVFLLKDHRVKVTDFGLSSLLSSGDGFHLEGEEFWRAFPYTSPERIRGEGQDERADIFSTGVILYELLTGTRPFQGKDESEVREQILLQKPIPPIDLRPSIPEVLSRVVEKAILKQADRRFQKAREFGLYLKRIAAMTAQKGREVQSTLPGETH